MRNKKHRYGLLFEAAIFALFICLVLPSSALPQAPFYEGKTIAVVQGRRPGGTGDLRVRALLPFLQKYIPGNPTIMTEYMPGGGGRKAGNHIFRVARPDGLTIGNSGAGLVSTAVLGEPGVRYNVDKLIFLGSINSRTSYVFLTNAKLGLDSLEKLRAHSGLRIGGQSVGHDIYINGRMFAWLLELKNPTFVTGYSGPEIDAALERGELDARAQIADNVPQRSPEWIEKKLMDFHAIMEFPKGFRFRHPVFDPVPALQDFAKNERERKLLQMFVNFRLVGSPYYVHPKTPKKQVEILKTAFNKALQDPQLPESLRKLVGADPEPVLPDEQATVVKEIPRDPETIELFKKFVGAGPLPPR